MPTSNKSEIDTNLSCEESLSRDISFAYSNTLFASVDAQFAFNDASFAYSDTSFAYMDAEFAYCYNLCNARTEEVSVWPRCCSVRKN